MDRRAFVKLLGLACGAMSLGPVGLAGPEAAISDQERFSRLFDIVLEQHREFLVENLNKQIPLLLYLQDPLTSFDIKEINGSGHGR